MKTLKYKGFTLIEIILAITLLSILFSLLVLAINPRNIISEVNDNKRETDALTIYQALEQYVIKNNTYPNSIKNMPNNSSAYICKTTATSCNSNTNTQINLSSILVPTYMSKIPEYSTDTNNSGFYVVRDTNGKIGIGGVKQVNNITFVKGLESQSFATTPIPPIVSNGLVLHLDAGNASSYPGTGTTWNDLSGQNNHFTWSSPAPAYTTYNNTPVISTTPTYLSLRAVKSNTYNGMRTGNSSYTVFSFFRPNSIASNKILVSFGPANNNCGGESVHAIGIGGNGKFVGGSCGALGTWLSSSGVVPTTDRFWNVSTTYDGTTENVYVNASLDKSASSFTNITPVSMSNSISLGWIRDDGAFYSMDASIGIILIYNRALTAAEIQQNFNALKSRFGL